MVVVTLVARRSLGNTICTVMVLLILLAGIGVIVCGYRSDFIWPF